MTILRFYKVIAENIRGYRKHYAISQEKLAEMTGISKENISLIERAKTNPSLSVIYKISAALKIEPYMLLTPDAHKKG